MLKNRFALKLAIFIPYFLPYLGQGPRRNPESSFPPQQHQQEILLNAKKGLPKTDFASDGRQEVRRYKIYNKISRTLSKISKKVRKDPEVAQALDQLENQLRTGDFQVGRGARLLTGTKTVYYMRAGSKARLFFRYSPNERGAIEKIRKSNKNKEQEVIDNLKKNYD